MSLLERARRFIEEKEAWRGLEGKVEDLREKADRLGVLPSPIEDLEEVDWPCAMVAVFFGFLRCGHVPDLDSLNAGAALALYLADTAEKQDKGEKPDLRCGLSQEEARALLARLFCGQRARLTESGRIELVDG